MEKQLLFLLDYDLRLTEKQLCEEFYPFMHGGHGQGSRSSRVTRASKYKHSMTGLHRDFVPSKGPLTPPLDRRDSTLISVALPVSLSALSGGISLRDPLGSDDMEKPDLTVHKASYLTSSGDVPPSDHLFDHHTQKDKVLLASKLDTSFQELYDTISHESWNLSGLANANTGESEQPKATCKDTEQTTSLSHGELVTLLSTRQNRLLSHPPTTDRTRHRLSIEAVIEAYRKESFLDLSAWRVKDTAPTGFLSKMWSMGLGRGQGQVS